MPKRSQFSICQRYRLQIQIAQLKDLSQDCVKISHPYLSCFISRQRASKPGWLGSGHLEMDSRYRYKKIEFYPKSTIIGLFLVKDVQTSPHPSRGGIIAIFIFLCLQFNSVSSQFLSVSPTKNDCKNVLSSEVAKFTGKMRNVLQRKKNQFTHFCDFQFLSYGR